MRDTAATPEGGVRRDIALLLATVQYFTRISAPAWVGHSRQRLNDGARYFPLVGALVGAVGAFAFVLAGRLFPHRVAVLPRGRGQICQPPQVFRSSGFHPAARVDAVRRTPANLAIADAG